MLISDWSSDVCSSDLPQLRWRTYSDQLTTIATTLGAQLCITLGALLAEVPPTRPPPVVGTAPTLEVVGGVTPQPSSYEGPTGIDRKRAVWGKSVSVRGGLGGWRINKK